MANNKPGSRLIKAAGAVAWRPGPDGEPEVLLVHRKKYDDWSLPKGKAEPGEPLPVTAVREVLEESGVRLALGRRLVSVRYNVGGRPKRVHYWAARAVSVDPQAVPNAEVDEVAWLTAARALEKVSYPHDHAVLADFAARPAQTVPLILLRHAKALPKNDWTDADLGRPLDDAGRSEAKALAGLLACFAPRPRLISSPALRCADTVRPLSELTGQAVREEPSLYVHNPASGTSAADPGPAIMALFREVAAAGEPSVICVHRENMPALQAAAVAAVAGRSSGAAPAADPPGAGLAGAGLPGVGLPGAELPREWDDTLPTSGFWVLNIACPDPEQPPAAPQAPDPATPSPDAGPRWWRRLRWRAGQGGKANDSGTNGSGANGSGANGDPAGDDPPAGVLISADRYELAAPC
jgi:8-oxo-(d)GTP phosphatase